MFKKLNLIIAAVACFATLHGADLVVTGSNVLASKAQYGSQVKIGVAGQTITAGQALYLQPITSGSMMLLSASTANAFTGIALNNAAAGQPVSYVVYDPAFQPGATLHVNDVLAVSGTTPGNICPVADVTGTANHGMSVTVLGVATSATTIYLNPTASGTATP